MMTLEDLPRVMRVDLLRPAASAATAAGGSPSRRGRQPAAVSAALATSVESVRRLHTGVLNRRGLPTTSRASPSPDARHQHKQLSFEGHLRGSGMTVHVEVVD